MPILDHLEPQAVFSYFEQLCAIPHGSGNTKAISDFLVRFAAAHHLRCIQDAHNNVVIFSPGTPGYETAAPVILQGHMDMVCETAPDCTKDMTREGLDLFVDGDTIGARGTTLGGDDGIAVAMALAILDADDIPHPPLEIVITVDEETGMLGAAVLDASVLKGRTMLNLDSEDEGVLTVSCAGGVVVTYTCPIAREHKTGSTLTLDISGLLGGHSGSDIHLERGNGNLIMARIIDRLMVAGEPAIVSFNGGTKDNAINRECKAVLVYADHAAAEAAAQIAKDIIADVTAELEVFDPGFTCTVEIADDAEVEAMDQKSALALIRALRLAPNGVIRRNVATDGSVEVSSNIGVVATSDDQVKIMLSPRSSITSLQNEFKDRLQTLADVLGFDAKFEFEYPGWSYAEHSPVRDVFVESYRELFGSELRIESIHAGLECGLFAEALHGLDAIAVGPTLSDVHTPDESMELASAERFYELLIDVLKRLAA